MVEDALGTLVATIDFACVDIRLTSTLAGLQILHLLNFIAAREISIANQLPDTLNARVIVELPWLRVLPVFQAHPCKVSSVHFDSFSSFFLHDVSG